MSDDGSVGAFESDLDDNVKVLTVPELWDQVDAQATRWRNEGPSDAIERLSKVFLAAERRVGYEIVSPIFRYAVAYPSGTIEGMWPSDVSGPRAAP